MTILARRTWRTRLSKVPGSQEKRARRISNTLSELRTQLTPQFAKSIVRIPDSARKQGNAACVPGGFTVVELLVTLLVVGVVFLAFTTTFAGVENISKKGGDVALASQHALAKLESYENLNFNSLPATSPSGSLQQVEDFSSSLPTVLEQPRVGKVYINTVSNTLKQVDVQVTFGSGASQRFIEYVTMIQKNGIGR
jgi:prepilin-type N-terminal cleavage/methylation domain-containing protein